MHLLIVLTLTCFGQALFQDQGTIQDMKIKPTNNLVAMMVQSQGQNFMQVFESTNKKFYYRIFDIDGTIKCTSRLSFKNIKPVVWSHQNHPILILDDQYIVLFHSTYGQFYSTKTFQSKILLSDFHYKSSQQKEWVLILLLEDGKVHELSGYTENFQITKQREIMNVGQRKVLKMQYSVKSDILYVQLQSSTEKQGIYILEVQTKSGLVKQKLWKGYSLGVLDYQQKSFLLVENNSRLLSLSKDGVPKILVSFNDLNNVSKSLTVMGFFHSNQFLVVLRQDSASNKSQMLFYNTTDGSLSDRLVLDFKPKANNGWYFGESEFLLMNQTDHVRLFRLGNKQSISMLIYSKIKIVLISLLLFGAVFIYYAVRNSKLKGFTKFEQISRCTQDSIQKVDH